MSLPPNEEKKPDFSNLPRGAISMKGLPVNRNARLPSIRTPRDLTLGSQPKRTFLPNIPVRREKKRATDLEKTLVPPQFQNSAGNSLLKDAGRGDGRKKDSGRGKAVIIQTEGSVFGEGISGDLVSRRERQKDSYQSYGRAGTSHGIAIKKEQVKSELSHTIETLNNLLREDFIDDGDEVEERLKPITYPDVKYEENTKKEEDSKEGGQKFVKQNFDPEIAKNMGFDVEKVAKFIKKEKGVEEIKRPVEPSFAELNEDIFKCFNLSQSELLLLQLPNCVTVPESNVDADSSQNHRSQQNGETDLSDDQKKNSSLSSLPEGRIGSLQLLKSGKIRLVLGALKFELHTINPLFSKLEAVSVRTNANSGDLVCLGSMGQKLIFIPEIDTLLE